MFCESCGAALKDGAKFCGSCGAKVESSATAASSSVVNSIRLAALPVGLANCEINIKSVTAEGPDSDGDLSISITYEVTNKSDEDWEYLSVRTQLLNAAGQIVEDTQDTHEQSFDAGETEELQASFYRVKAKFLGENPEKAHVVINAIASTLIQQKLGQVDIPANAFEVTALKPTKLGESVQLISGSLWKTEPDDDKDCRVEVKALIQNLTDKNLPLVKIAAEVKDKKGNEVADAGGSDEVRPGSIATVSGSGYTKDKKLIGAKADLAVLVYTPVAAGVSQHCGVQITSDSQADEENEVSARYVFTFGFIPNNKSVERVTCGDPSGCGTDEINIIVTDGVMTCFENPGESFDNCDDEALGNSDDSRYEEIFNKFLSNLETNLDPKSNLAKYAFTHFLGNDCAGTLRSVATLDDCGEFSNPRGKFDGLNYIRFVFEKNETIVNEEVVVIYK